MRIEFIETGERVNLETLNRKPFFDSDASVIAANIIQEVRSRGDAAVAEYTLALDKANRPTAEVGKREVERGMRELGGAMQEALMEAADAIKAFHENQLPTSSFISRADGSMVGTRVTPIESVGIYIPGGRASYPSTVLMNVIPAKAAGVKRICIVSPPREDGTLDPAILGAANLLEISEIYAIGGAQAIAALAYGTETIDPVDKIVGPGNVYVTAAKRLVSGDVGIDMIAGPSEVAILADEGADGTLVAIDLLAQAEHDPDAATFLVTTDETLVDDVIERMEQLLGRSTRKEITKAAIDSNCFAFICDDMSTAIEVINDIAPEHLEIMVDEPMELLGMIKNAGAIFLGPWTPQSVGDYMAGPSHTLPTGGTARFSSPLSVLDFIKRSSVISYSYTALSNQSRHIVELANAEGLWAHGRSVEMRFEEVD
ncbi:MAG: histidinol dehydrogenase [Coriobacteriia bacterium]|nr:histidinol dehydrogenase [Coriobacteriia bacterium]